MERKALSKTSSKATTPAIPITLGLPAFATDGIVKRSGISVLYTQLPTIGVYAHNPLRGSMSDIGMFRQLRVSGTIITGR